MSLYLSLFIKIKIIYSLHLSISLSISLFILYAFFLSLSILFLNFLPFLKGGIESIGHKVNPEVIQSIYKDYVIPLTKEIEVQYLLQRIDQPNLVYFKGDPFASEIALDYMNHNSKAIKELGNLNEVFNQVVAGTSW